MRDRIISMNRANTASNSNEKKEQIINRLPLFLKGKGKMEKITNRASKCIVEW